MELNAFKNEAELLSHEKSVSVHVKTFKGVNSQDLWILTSYSFLYPLMTLGSWHVMQTFQSWYVFT